MDEDDIADCVLETYERIIDEQAQEIEKLNRIADDQKSILKGIMRNIQEYLK